MKSHYTHLIIGGGVIGLCSAYFLSKSGHKVVVVERESSRRETCSDRNAGMVVPSHFIPLAAPGVISQGLKWMFNRRSPFYLRPRLDLNLWSWIWLFWKHSNAKHVENSKELLRDLSMESRSLFEQLSDELDFPLVKKGLLMLCQSDDGLQEESHVASMANEIGIKAEVCSPGRLHELDPNIEMKSIGGVWFPEDCHLDSELFLSALRRGIQNNGGEFLNEEIVHFRKQQNRIEGAETSSGNVLTSDYYLIAGGAWSPDLASKLGIKLPMQGGKGYSFTLMNPPQIPSLCSLLKEGRVAVTPMGSHLRVAGTMEICGNDLSIDPVRLEGIKKSFCQFFPQFTDNDFSDLKAWSGLRPCSPDGLPYIGPVKSLSNVMIASGHAMLGLSLGPVTGKLIADLHKKREVDLRLSPNRFS